MKKGIVKKGFFVPGVLVLVLCSFTACGSDGGKKIYQDVLERYVVAMDENWDMDTLVSADMSYLYAFEQNSKEKIGFTFYDVDENGTPELLIGQMMPGDFYKGMIYDMYTVVDGNVISVLSSAERYRYYLCEDNRIALEASGGAGYSYYMFHDFDGERGSLRTKEAVIYDGDYNREAPWFYTSGSLEQTDYSPTTEREAREIIESYVHKGFEVTPFSKY